MLDRFEKPLKMTCRVLAVLFLAQIAHLFLRQSPVDGLRIPAVPTWIERTNTGAQSSSSARTNSAAKKTETNSIAIKSPDKQSTNIATETTNSITAQTNIVTTNSLSTRTNSITTNTAALAADKKETNSPSRKSSRGRMSSGKSGSKMDLPAPIQARIDWVIKSEIFGSIPRPVPMGILGIAGDDVFLRTPSGQTGIVKEGAELDGVKILKIGTNRVLVESGGEKQELMIFAGTGGESLLPKEKEKESTK